jgi:hypothetical protein
MPGSRRRRASKTSFEVIIDPDFLESLRRRGRSESKIIGEAIRVAAESWGFPHRHAGVGLRHDVKQFLRNR